MTNQEILTKAIEKAIDGGWKCQYGEFQRIVSPAADIIDWVMFWDRKYAKALNVEAVIFNHDFAKAIWPGQAEIPGLTIKGDFPAWQYGLQQMVVADDPIEYLKENI